MKRVVIRASEWLRNVGQEDYISRLLTVSGQKCCLGIAASTCGIENHYIEDVGTPNEVKTKNSCFSPWIKICGLADQAMTENDNSGTNDEEKIKFLRPLFREANMTIVWRPDL